MDLIRQYDDIAATSDEGHGISNNWLGLFLNEITRKITFKLCITGSFRGEFTSEKPPVEFHS